MYILRSKFNEWEVENKNENKLRFDNNTLLMTHMFGA